MATKNDRYRNSPAPIGYVCRNKPELICKDNIDINGINCKFMEFIIASGIFDVPNCTIYDDFISNLSSEEEDIVEIPVEPCPKVVEVIDVDAEVDVATPHKKEESLVAVKKEVICEEPLATSETSNDFVEDIKISASPKHTKITVKKELSGHTSEKVVSEKKIKKHDHGIKRSPHRKKLKERKDTYNEYDSGNESHSKKSRHKIRDGNKSDGESNSRSKHRKKGNENDSNSYNRRGDHKKREGYQSDSISHKSRGDHKREGFESNSYNYETKLKREPDYYSDDSDSSIRKATGRVYSPTPGCSKDYYPDDYDRTLTNIKQEAQIGHLYGTYHCEICNLSLNSHATYQSHITGKRHQKAVNARNVAGVVSTATEDVTKYPKSPPGYYRKKLDGPAHIQASVDQDIQMPCPALDSVIEIHGVTEVTYYCSLCNALCSPNCIIAHLNGFKHQLHCLKEFYPDKYEKWKYYPKYQIECDVRNLLKDVERRCGRGRMRVEKDILERESCIPEFQMAALRDPDMPSTSQAGSGLDFSDNYLTSSIPDPTKSGYYCRMCDSHSNSPQMWQNHIVGKRHLTNLKKAPGTAPSKNKYIPAPNVRPHLETLLRDVESPVVGLSQVREIRKPEIDGITYNCYLCSACISCIEIVDHILSRKHREKYLEYIQHPELETLRSCQVSESALDSIVDEMCSRVEAERGRGITEVYYAKNAVRK